MRDAWVVNLSTTHKENIMMDAFLKLSPELKNKWEESLKKNVGVDVTEELKDLVKIYGEAEEHLKEKEESSLSQLVRFMKQFIEIQDERKRISQKLAGLTNKLRPHDHEDEEEDDE
jgi:tRNA uridine 5-carbamoylmethylation protein Kti12